MSFRLYESAWVQVEGIDDPVQVRKDRTNHAAFNVAGYQYDIDARALSAKDQAPPIVALLSLQAAREAGLSSGYGAGLGRDD